MDNNYLFNIVVLVFNKLNKDIEDYIETSLSEGLEVKLYVRGREGFGTGDVIPPEVKKNFNNQNTSGVLAVTDDADAARELKKLGLAVTGYQAEGEPLTHFSVNYVVSELAMVEDDYFNLIYMRAHNIPLLIACTERTIIREMTADDLTAMYELYSDEAVAKWVEPLYEYEKELEFTKAYIENVYSFYGYGLWLVFDRKTGELIGRAGISVREIDGEKRCELGYIIRGDRQRQGMGFEVSTAVMEYAADCLLIDELWLCIEKDNTASIGLGKKLGFTLYGSSVCDGKDCYLYRKKLIHNQ